MLQAMDSEAWRRSRFELHVISDRAGREGKWCRDDFLGSAMANILIFWSENAPFHGAKQSL